ncbi:MAG: sucrase ferredoxin [Cyanophyceae cyanobacterium]
MSAQATLDLSRCRFCSEVSKATGEDPIGTAGTCQHWLIVELPLPWSEKLLLEPRTQPLIAALKELIFKQGVLIRPLAIAPDPEYSTPGHIRTLYYRQPSRCFAHYSKQEFIVPEAEFPQLVSALLQQLRQQPNELPRFERYLQATDTIRELLVCTHGNVDAACARFGYPIYKQLRHDYAPQSEGKLRVWRCSHFGGHQFAPTLIDLPEGRYWGHLEPEVLDALVYRQGDVGKLRSFYRGWAGLSKFEQIVEREIWMQEGWNWLSYPKAGQSQPRGIWGLLDRALSWIPVPMLQLWWRLQRQKAKQMRVRIDFRRSDAAVTEGYEAQVVANGQVMSALQSGKEMALQPIQQFLVRNLRKV